MKHYALFRIDEVIESHEMVGIARRRLILTESDEPLTDTSSVLREVQAGRHGPFMWPVTRVDAVVEFSEELTRGAMLIRDHEHLRIWVLPVAQDVNVEVPEV